MSKWHKSNPVGYPFNPLKDGWHIIHFSDGNERACFWEAETKTWTEEPTRRNHLRAKAEMMGSEVYIGELVLNRSPVREDTAPAEFPASILVAFYKRTNRCAGVAVNLDDRMTFEQVEEETDIYESQEYVSAILAENTHLLIEENRILKEALEWYSEEVLAYAVTQTTEPRSAAHEDKGKKARKALADAKAIMKSFREETKSDFREGDNVVCIAKQNCSANIEIGDIVFVRTKLDNTFTDTKGRVWLVKNFERQYGPSQWKRKERERLEAKGE